MNEISAKDIEWTHEKNTKLTLNHYALVFDHSPYTVVVYPHFRSTRFTFLLIFLLSVQWGLAAQMFVMAAYLAPFNNSIGGEFVTIQDEVTHSFPSISHFSRYNETNSDVESSGALLLELMFELLEEHSILFSGTIFPNSPQSMHLNSFHQRHSQEVSYSDFFLEYSAIGSFLSSYCDREHFVKHNALWKISTLFCHISDIAPSDSVGSRSSTFLSSALQSQAPSRLSLLPSSSSSSFDSFRDSSSMSVYYYSLCP